MVLNAVGREIPEEVAGRKLVPFAGAFKTLPCKRKAAPLIKHIGRDDRKLVPSLEEAIRRVGLKDGMTISFHHHLRNGDGVINLVVDTIASMGIKDLRLAQVALFPVHEPIIEHLKNGVITRIEGSINGPVGLYASAGKLKAPVVLRSHGGRTRAVEADDLHVDVAFVGAAMADDYGNCNGMYGPSAFGPISYSMIDALYADHVIVLTDNLVDYPATPLSIDQSRVDYVVEVDSIGDPKGIESGTTKITSSPTRLKIARYVIEVLRHSGLVKDGFSFQAGAGGISLAVVKYLGELLEEEDVIASFAMGGTTRFLVDILEKGRVKKILDAQAFDLASLDSLRNNPNHVEVSAYMYANPHTRGAIVNRVDTGFLGATEVDLDFNVNVNTHSDGMMLHGTGGHSDVAAGSKLTFITVPLYRGRLPIIVDKVTNVTTPGETIDVVVTDAGIAINPRRKDLMEKMEGTGLPIRSIEELYEEAISITGKPEKPEFTDDIIGIIEYRDGSTIDVIRKVKGYEYGG